MAAELSTGTPLESHKLTDSMQVTYFDVRPGKEGVSSMRCRLPGVRSLQRPARRHIPGIPGHRRRHVTVHVDGGAYELASYDVYRKDVADLLATDPNALPDFADAVRSSYTESWKHHADLSNLP